MAKFQQHQGFGAGYTEWRQQPDQQSFNRSEALDLAGQAVLNSLEVSVTPHVVEVLPNPEIQELLTDNNEIHEIRQKFLSEEAA